MRKTLVFLLFTVINTVCHGQPGPSTLSVSFNLSPNYSNTQLPKQFSGRLITFLNGKPIISGSSKDLYLRSQPNPYGQNKAVFNIDGDPSGVDVFDSVSIGITLDGVSYFASSGVKNSNSFFIADFSGEYNQPIIRDADFSVSTRYPNPRPAEEELKAAAEEVQSNTVKSSGPYLVIKTSDHEQISDALVICNGDTLAQNSSGLYLPHEWIKTKTRLEVYHPNYPSLILDSCILPIETVYLLKEHEPYYVDMGLKHPLKNNNHQKIALRFNAATDQKTIDSCLQEICANQHYKIAYHYPDSLKVHNEMIYGGVADLNRIVLLERRTPSTIGNSYINQLNYVKKRYPIDGIFRPINHATFLNNKVTVIYKKEASKKTIQDIEDKYHLNGLQSEYQQGNNPLKINYTLDVFITPNYLVDQLMKNQYVQNVIIGKVEYIHY
jgi:hypothetical protein